MSQIETTLTDTSNENIVIDVSNENIVIDASNENIVIDASNQELLLKKKVEYIQKMRYIQIENKKKEFINVICRQTELSEEEAKQQLEECNYDCNIVMNKYFGIKEKEQVKQNVNQIIYSEIRNMMDDGARNFRIEQEKANYIQKMQEQRQQARQQTQQQSKQIKEKQE